MFNSRKVLAMIAGISAITLLVGACSSSTDTDSGPTSDASVTDNAGSESETDANADADAGTDAEADSESGDSIGTLTIARFTQVDLQVVFDEFDGFTEVLEEAVAAKGGSIEWIDVSAHSDNSQCATIARTLASKNLDAAIVAGTPCIIASSQQMPNVPIFATGMGSPVEAGVAESIEHPGGNVSGTWRGEDFAKPVIDGVATVTPMPVKLGVIYDQSNSATTQWIDWAEVDAVEHGIELVRGGVTTNEDVPAQARNLAPKVDAILVPPDGMVGAAVPAIAAAAQTEGIPVYTGGLKDAATILGVVADIGDAYYDMGRLTGEVALKVLIDGQDVGDVGFEQSSTFTWTVNMDSMAALGITIPRETLDSADQVQAAN